MSGRLCDIEKVNDFYVYQLAEVVVGTGTLVISIATSYVDMVIYIVIYGFCDGAFITALNVLILNCVSPEKTPAALGWEMQVTSLFTASGPPVAGITRGHSDLPKPQFQSEAKCAAFSVRMSFYSYANKTHFRKKGYALVLNIRVFGTLKWVIVLARTFLNDAHQPEVVVLHYWGAIFPHFLAIRLSKRKDT